MKAVVNLPHLAARDPVAAVGGPETQPEMDFGVPSSTQTTPRTSPATSPVSSPARSSRRAASQSPPHPRRALEAFAPLTLICLAVLGWMSFQTWQLFNDRQALRAAHANLQTTVDNAAKLRGSLDALAADTQRLAEAGNASARVLVEELKKRGVTINPNPAAVPK